jgi:hypothetical protein
MILAISRVRLMSTTVDEAFGQSQSLLSEYGFADYLAGR